jgi:hypothetical protein
MNLQGIDRELHEVELHHASQDHGIQVRPCIVVQGPLAWVGLERGIHLLQL